MLKITVYKFIIIFFPKMMTMRKKPDYDDFEIFRKNMTFLD